MTVIHVPIIRWVDSAIPGWVECLLIDASGRTWSIVDKLPVFTHDATLDENSLYPQPGILACEIVNEKIDVRGRRILTVNTEKPWGIESTDGTTHFDVLQEQVEVV